LRFAIPYVVFTILFWQNTFAQEKESARIINFSSAKSSALVNLNSRVKSTLTLPFFEDFSNGAIQLWDQSSTVFINTSFPVNPPTIGVATFDGLNELGYPYNFDDPYAQGPADTLCSASFNLSSYNENSQIFLSFFYEAGGIGNAPELEDSLTLEFFSPFGPGQWNKIWSSTGNESIDTFNQVFIPINEAIYLLDGFKFRFINHSTLSGEYDLWHLDYISLDANVDPANYIFDEVAQQRPYHSLLTEYSAMPWSHFKANASSHMTNAFPAYQRNLGNDENIVTGFSITNFLNTTQTFNAVDLNTALNANSSFVRPLNLNGYVYPTTPEPSSQFVNFEVKTFINPTDSHLENDTARFIQKFHNYYAYDDGSSEKAYSVSASGANVAMKFRSEIPDSLLGVYIHWIPFGFDVSDETFILRAWQDGGAEPGAELGENFTYQHPHYWEAGMNIWTYYAFDTPQPVDGNFYVGWVQSGDVELPVGLDKNTDFNPTKLFYNLGFGTDWQASTIQGTVMIRPVLQSGNTNWTGISNLHFQPALNVFPNPTEDYLRIENLNNTSQYTFSLRNATGSLVELLTVSNQTSATLDLSAHSAGIYFLNAISSSGDSQIFKVVLQ
jgi:hypothetical protein